MAYLKDVFELFDHQHQRYTYRAENHHGAFHDHACRPIGNFRVDYFHDEILVDRTGNRV